MTCRIFFPDQGSNPLLLQWKHITQPRDTRGFPVHVLLKEIVIHFLSHSSFLVPSGPLWLVVTIVFWGVCVCVCGYYDVFCVCVYGYYIGHTFGFWTQFQPTDAGDTSGDPTIQPNSDSINLEIVPYSVGYRGSVLRLCYQTQVQLLIAQESNIRDTCWVKAKIALLGKLTILGRSWTHVPKNQIPIVDQRARDFKELDVQQQMNG